MGRVLVCYYTRGGTTERMAEEIGDGLREGSDGLEVEVKPVEEAAPSDLPDYDGLVLGSPTYYGLPSAEVKEFIDESVRHHGDLEGMVGGAFASSANTAGGNETTIISLIEALLIHGMVVQGKVDGDHYGPVVVGTPDDGELKQCREYGRIIARLLERVGGANP